MMGHSHLIADMGWGGVPLLWPMSHHLQGFHFKTNGAFEHITTSLVMATTLALLLTGVLTACGSVPDGAPQHTTLPPVTRHAQCVSHDGLPDGACTPGSVFPDATMEKICVPGYTKTVRHVSAATKRAVEASYGFSHLPADQEEIDHLIPLELGGSNEIANLWPEAATGYGYKQKDTVEHRLHLRVCSHLEPLAKAQQAIASNWKAA